MSRQRSCAALSKCTSMRGWGSYSIAVLPTDEDITTQTGKLLWLQSRFHHILGNATYTGS